MCTEVGQYMSPHQVLASSCSYCGSLYGRRLYPGGSAHQDLLRTRPKVGPEWVQIWADMVSRGTDYWPFSADNRYQNGPISGPMWSHYGDPPEPLYRGGHHMVCYVAP